MEKVLEIAIYKINGDVEIFETARTKMKAKLTTYPGYCFGLTFKDLEKEGVYLDYYLWNSLKEAEHAAESFQSDAEAKDFLGCVAKITHFNHYQPQDNTLMDANDFSAGEILEFALGEIKSDALPTLKEIKPTVLELAKKQRGFKKISSAVDAHNKHVMFDALCWQRLSDATDAMTALHEMPVCQNFMGSFEKDLFFGHLTRA